jgi:hypothetical protein
MLTFLCSGGIFSRGKVDIATACVSVGIESFGRGCGLRIRMHAHIFEIHAKAGFREVTCLLIERLSAAWRNHIMPV